MYPPLGAILTSQHIFDVHLQIRVTTPTTPGLVGREWPQD